MEFISPVARPCECHQGPSHPSRLCFPYKLDEDFIIGENHLEELRDASNVQSTFESNEHTKMLRLEWNVSTDQFHITIGDYPLPAV